MILLIDQPITLAVQAFLNALRLPYTALDQHTLAVGDGETVLTLAPRQWLDALHQQLKREGIAPAPIELAMAWRTTFLYMQQLDRWKAYYDKLTLEQKCSGVICHLQEHLLATLLNARSQYQRNEAVGLSLAKADILQKQIEPSEHLVIALGGELSQAAALSVPFLAGCGEPFNYYHCFRYQDMLGRGAGLGLLTLPGRPRYRYLDHYGWDTNQRLYDGLMLIVSKDFAQRERLDQLVRRLSKPVAVYTCAAGRFEMSEFQKELDTLQRTLLRNHEP